MNDFFNAALGLHAKDLEAYQMACRAFVLFFVSLVLIRIAGIKTLGKASAFDTITYLMMGAILGRAVVTGQSFLGSILATLVIMLLHRGLAWLTFKSKRAGSIFKGDKILLLKNGKKNHENLERTNISEEDLLEAMRREGITSSLEDVKEIYLERSGEISIIKN